MSEKQQKRIFWQGTEKCTVKLQSKEDCFLQDMSTYLYLSIPEIQILYLACDFSC